MSSQDLIIYIATVCGIELDEIILLKIANKTKGYNLPDFINFIESNLDHSNLSYKNPLQKFLTFCKLYNLQIKIKKEKDIQTDSQKLANKFKSVKVMLENEILQGKNPRLSFIRDYRTGQNYFSDFEITVLEKIGNIRYLINLSNSFELEDKINSSILSILHPNSTPALTTVTNFRRIQA